MTKIATGSYLQSLVTNGGGGSLGLTSSKCYTYQSILELDGFSISSVLSNGRLVRESLITYSSTQNVEITVTGSCSISNSGSIFSFQLSTSNPVDVDLTVTIRFGYSYSKGGLTSFGTGSATATIRSGGTSGFGSTSSTRTGIVTFNLSSATINPTSSDSQTYSATLGSTEIVDNTTSTATTITWACEDETVSDGELLNFAWFDNTGTLTPEMIYNRLQNHQNMWIQMSARVGATQTVTNITANSSNLDGSTTTVDVSSSSSTLIQILRIVTYSNPSSADDINIQTVYITPGVDNVITLPAAALLSHI